MNRTKPNSRFDAAMDKVNRSLAARIVAGQVAELVGRNRGLHRGAANSVLGVADGALTAYRLANPWDSEHDATARDIKARVDGAIDYVRTATPKRVADDLKHHAQKVIRDTVPLATPMANTVSGEIARRYKIGENLGETEFDVGTMVVGGGLAAKGLRALKGAELSSPAKFVAQGFNEAKAADLAAPYDKMGHHYYRRAGYPQQRRGQSSIIPPVRLPKFLSDSSFNVLKPKNISVGDFYELHFKVDPSFWGARLPNTGKGQGWSGRRLGLKKYNLSERLWYGAPPPLKITAGGAVTGYGANALNSNALTERTW